MYVLGECRFTGKPLRVLKRSGLPELQEGGDTESADGDSLQLAPLPEPTLAPPADRSPGEGDNMSTGDVVNRL